MPKQKLEYPHARRRTLSDPLSAALLPPPDESPFERETRLKAERDAKTVSDSIDELIRIERNEKKKNKAEVNVLLLGQSESGKSTTLKRKYFEFWFVLPTRHVRYCRSACSAAVQAYLCTFTRGVSLLRTPALDFFTVQ